MKKFFMRLWKEQKAQDLTEYALLLVLIALAAITSMKTLSNGIQNAYSTVASNVAAGTDGGGGGGGRFGGRF
jgi:Flp pilus assembly pilin Flp